MIPPVIDLFQIVQPTFFSIKRYYTQKAKNIYAKMLKQAKLFERASPTHYINYIIICLIGIRCTAARKIAFKQQNAQKSTQLYYNYRYPRQTTGVLRV